MNSFRLQVLAARQQLEAVRMQTDVVAACIDGLLQALPVECPHPQDSRVDASSLTRARYWCRACNQFVDGALDAEGPASPSGLRP